MKVAVCGGRYYSDQEYLFAVLDKVHESYSITTIMHGGAKGADTLVGMWARSRHIGVIKCYEALWNKYGRFAGPMRNRLMLEDSPDLVIAFPGGAGTENMINQAQKHKIPVMYKQTLGLRKWSYLP